MGLGTCLRCGRSSLLLPSPRFWLFLFFLFSTTPPVIAVFFIAIRLLAGFSTDRCFTVNADINILVGRICQFLLLRIFSLDYFWWASPRFLRWGGRRSNCRRGGIAFGLRDCRRCLLLLFCRLRRGWGWANFGLRPAT